MNLVDYWKKRCELAEAYIEESPCDPDIYKEQLDAWNNWCEFKKLPIPVVSKFVARCGSCKQELTLVRLGKHQCDNENCPSNVC
jgi:hypothetical protein